jgi:prepilin-type N-terminal cleavage/methylation domain-containing protein
MRSMDYTQSRRMGFTLIELMVVIVIIAILVTMAITRLNSMRAKAKDVQTASNLAAINSALEAFAVDNNGMYPFRIRWFDAATANAAGFDPSVATDTGTGMTSDPGNWFSMGLIGGVRTVKADFSDHTWSRAPTITELEEGYTGMREHKVIQPFGWDTANPDFYRRFNQYSDPLYALGYLKSYPTNPFLKRPMGAVMWDYGDANDDRDTSGPPFHTSPVNNYASSVPASDVVPTPGDFVYTFFYEGTGNQIFDPQGVSEARRSYTARSPQMTDPDGGIYYLDVIDAYQLWAYGDIPKNGATYAIYRNNAQGLQVRGHAQAKKDWNGNGTKDMFELGIIQYYKRTGGADSATRDSGGARIEF